VATVLLMSSGHALAGKFCALVNGNYLLDAEFEQRGPDGGLQHWASSQHAGEPSFELEFAGGELTISKTGTQPWLYFRQNLAAEELAGKKLALNAELRLDLEKPSVPQGFVAGGGVKIVARSSALKGSRLLLRSILDHQPLLGTTDWFPVQVVVRLPKKTGVIEVGVLHQADGTMQVRNLSLQLVDESAGRCKVSPNAIIGIPVKPAGLR